MRLPPAAALLALTCVGCLKIKVVHDDGGAPAGPSVHAQVLYVFNVERSATNLVNSYAGLIVFMNDSLKKANIEVDQLAVAPLYGTTNGQPRLLFGQNADSGDASAALLAATTSGGFDPPAPGSAPEQLNLAHLAAQLDSATLPADPEAGPAPPFFGAPRDLFLIVTVQPTRRLCGVDDPACALDGRAPADLFTSVNADGTAAWLTLPGGSYPPRHTFQLFVTTSEGESRAAFDARCAAQPGFPKLLLDVIEPSPAAYYGPLAQALGQAGWPAAQRDLCAALSDNRVQMAKDLVAQLKQMLGG